MPQKPSSQIQTQKQEYICDVCAKKFSTKQALLSHKHYKHPEMKNGSTIAEVTVKAEKPDISRNVSPTDIGPESPETPEQEKARLLEEIESLKKEAQQYTIQKPEVQTPEVSPTPPKLSPPPVKESNVPWKKRTFSTVPGAEPAKRVQVQDLKGITPEIQKELLKKLSSSKPTKAALEFADSAPSTIEFKQGSWALVYKEDLIVRAVPFIWQQDKETKQNWAIFLEQQFYGRKIGFGQLSYPLLIMGFDKSRDYVDYFGRGFLIAVDEISQLQIPLHLPDSEAKLNMRLEDNAFKSQEMALYRELIIHAKKKWNWTLIIILVVVLILGGVGVYFIYTHPHFLQGLSGALLPH